MISLTLIKQINKDRNLAKLKKKENSAEERLYVTGFYKIKLPFTGLKIHNSKQKYAIGFKFSLVIL